MLTEAIIQTSTPTSLKVGGADQDEILILESISGLSDVKVNQFLGDFAREGSYYQGRRAERRNPVFNFRIQPNYAEDIEASDVREMIYRMFMEPQRDSDAVQVLLKDDRRPDRYFIAYTETITAPIFEKDMKAQCSMQTVDAYLRSVNPTFGNRDMGWFRIPLPYEGSADTGLEVTLQVLSKTHDVYLHNGPDVMKLSHDFWGYFNPGDEIRISTSAGSRQILVNGQDKMVLLTPESPWLQLREQDNVLSAHGSATSWPFAATPDDHKVAITQYYYRASWWGI